jgi:alpha-beta hydrolase superfamily lysophospholipase
VAFDTRRVRAAGGAELQLYVSIAPGSPRAVVQINHGLAEHGSRYARFAAFLAQHGFHAYAHDHRGHGRTTAPGAPLGSFGPEPAAENVLADALAVRDHIAKAHPGLPVILFGHSMGATVALALLARHARLYRAAGLWNMPLASRIEARAGKALLAWERFRLGSDVPSRLVPRLTFQAWGKAVANARTPFDWLSRDAEEVEKYIADPHCGWLPSVGMWRAVFDFNLMVTERDALRAIPRSLPILLVGGSGDPSTKYGATMRRLEERFRRAGFSNLETRIYADARHESLNELNRNIIMEDFVRWAERAT